MRKQAGTRYLPFGFKLMVSYSVFIIVPAVLVGYLSNSVFVSSIRAQTQMNIRGTLQQMVDNIQYQMADIKRISDLLYYDEAMTDHLRHYEQGWISFEKTTKHLQPKFRSLMDATDQPFWLSVYLHNDTLPEIYRDYQGTDPLQSDGRLYDWYHIRRIADKDWYRSFPEEEYGVTMRWQRIEDDDRYGRISLLRRMIEIDRLRIKEVGFIRISVKLSHLFQSVDFRKIGDGAALLVTDEQGRVVIRSGERALPIGEIWNPAEASDSLVIRETIPGLDWHLHALVPKNITDRDTRKVGMITLLICLACIIVLIVAGLWVSRYFSRRIRKIVGVLNAFREGDFFKRIAFKGNDEFQLIAAALNEVGEKTQRLIDEVYVTNLRKTEAELESLQAQINPHFLYNTLSSISRLAKFGEVDKLHRMVRSLAAFYRLSLNEGRKMIPIAKELEQAQAYVDIQKIKYGDRLSVRFDVKADVYPYDTVKLILQPLIENVLKHGWVGDRIHIRICAEKQEDRILLKVIDDGVGMTRDRLREISKNDGVEGAGYGLRNVDERIKLHYGSDFGVRIYSRPGIGTAACIVIPCKRREPPAYEGGRVPSAL